MDHSAFTAVLGASCLLDLGIRVAQLVLHSVCGEPGLHKSRYLFPTEPEFSRAYEDEELEFWGDREPRATVMATFSAGVVRPDAKLPLSEGERVGVDIDRKEPQV